MKKTLITTLVALGLILSVGAQAATKTGTFASKATLAGTCTLSTSSIDFGAYDPRTGAIAYSTGTVKLTCSNKMAYTLGVDRANASDAYFSGSSSSLAFSSAASAPAILNTVTPPASGTSFVTSKNALLFNLYTNATRTTVWTGFTNHWVGANQFVTGTGSGDEQTVSIYGSLDKSQYVTPGTYAATMIMTAKF